MGISLVHSARQSTSLDLRQRFNLNQIIRLTDDILSMPPGALDTLLVAIASDPKRTNEIITESIGDSKEEGYLSVQSLYGSLIPNSENGHGERNSSGTITSFNPKDLAGLVSKEAEILVVPDVTYIGREGKKPVIGFAEHLSPRPEMSLLAIPSQFKKAKNLHASLMRERDFINKTLKEQYGRVGEVQREFLYSLRFSDMHVFSLENVATQLEISLSLVSRLRKKRLAKIGEEGFVVDVAMLMPTGDSVRRYHIHELLNEVFEEEITDGISLSDAEIAGNVKVSSRIARRTVNKYRTAAGIPDIKERKRSYEEGRTEAYHIPETLPELIANHK